MRNEVYNCDCMEFLKKCADKEFDLAIVDPPYGGGATVGRTFPQREVFTPPPKKKKTVQRTGGRSRKYQREGIAQTMHSAGYSGNTMEGGGRTFANGILRRHPNISSNCFA